MFAVQARYRKIVARHGFRVPDRYDDFAPAVERIRAALGPRRTVPCHNDLLAGNLLAVPDGVGGEEVRILDYEYSGNNDPCFELGNVWSEATLPRELLDVLIAAYFGRERPEQVARARLFALMTQTQIADRVGISQMHVSRLLAQTVAGLRRKLLSDD